uniref:Uncharacterized protein n=1 Tax=Plectus sambesii TaxID=2011161 RepID=A0A914VIQ9_9BILA
MADQRFFITSLLAQQEKAQQEMVKSSNVACVGEKKTRSSIDTSPTDMTSNALSTASTMPSRAQLPFWSMPSQEQAAMCSAGGGQGSSGVLINPFTFCPAQPYPVMPASMLSPYDQLALTSKSAFLLLSEAPGVHVRRGKHQKGGE